MSACHSQVESIHLRGRGLDARLEDLFDELGVQSQADPGYVSANVSEDGGGTNAHVSFLLKQPGPATLRTGTRSGSGFISKNNDDRSAEATFHFMAQTGIRRELTLSLNVVPWWNGPGCVLAAELRQGA